MNRMQHQLVEFHRAMNLTVGESVGLRDVELRANLIEEEAKETVDAIRRGDLTEAVDGLCDLLYVAFGAAVTFGLDLEPYFDEVHATNMAKKDGPVRESDGKRLKPPGWKPPRVAEMLAAGIGRQFSPPARTLGEHLKTYFEFKAAEIAGRGESAAVRRGLERNVEAAFWRYIAARDTAILRASGATTEAASLEMVDINGEVTAPLSRVPSEHDSAKLTDAVAEYATRIVESSLPGMPAYVNAANILKTLRRWPLVEIKASPFVGMRAVLTDGSKFVGMNSGDAGPIQHKFEIDDGHTYGGRCLVCGNECVAKMLEPCTLLSRCPGRRVPDEWLEAFQRGEIKEAEVFRRLEEQDAAGTIDEAGKP